MRISFIGSIFIASILASTLVSALYIYPLRDRKEAPASRVLLLLSALISWIGVVLWLTALIELWQLYLATPTAFSAATPAWARLILSVLKAIANLLPVRRWELGAFYALPFLLLPLALILRHPARAGAWLHRAAVTHLAFFWGVSAMTMWAPASSQRFAILGAGIVALYGTLLLCQVVSAFRA